MLPIVVACVFLGVATLTALFFKPSKITNYPSQGDDIIMFGDSLVYGVGATQGKNLPALLSKKIKKEIHNMGIPGTTSAQGLLRIKSVLKHNPRVVMVLFGGNDYLQEVPIEETFKNIDFIVTLLQEAGAVVVLLGIQGGILSDPYKDEFKKIAKKRGALLIPSVLEGIFGNNDLMSDHVHPNDKGYMLLANKILPVLRKAL